MGHTINLLDPEFRRDPYPSYATLREGKVQQIEPMGAWAITRREDVQYVLKHPEQFSSAAFQALLRPAWLGRNPIADSLLVKAGPEHAKLRALISRAFTPRTIATLEPRVTELANEAAESLRGHTGELDFVSQFASPFPARVIAEIIGLDPELHKRFQTWADHIAIVSPIEPPEELADAVRGSMKDMESYFGEVIAAHRAEPRDDLVGKLISAEVDGEVLHDEDILAFLFLLLPAGFETTRHLLANAMLAFLDAPEHYTALREDPSRIPAFVDEVLRHNTSVHTVPRITTEEVEIGGTTIPAGSPVFVVLGATGREPGHVEDPERFDPSRESTGLLSFGHGIHYCLGAALARLEARVGIQALSERFRGFEPGAGELTWNVSTTVRGPQRLPVRPLV